MSESITAARYLHDVASRSAPLDWIRNVIPDDDDVEFRFSQGPHKGHFVCSWRRLFTEQAVLDQLFYHCVPAHWQPASACDITCEQAVHFAEALLDVAGTQLEALTLLRCQRVATGDWHATYDKDIGQWELFYNNNPTPTYRYRAGARIITPGALNTTSVSWGVNLKTLQPLLDKIEEQS